jgi:hypothetical protein
MINFNCNIKVKHNFKNIEAITKKIPQIAKEITDDILKNIQGYAIRLENGHNSEGILVEMIDMSTKEVKGRVYADPSKFMTENGQSYLWFEYFGTRTICRTRAHRYNKTLYRIRLYRMVYTCE